MTDAEEPHELSETLGRAAHDLKNPLTVIRAQAQIAQFQLSRPDPNPAALDRRMATIIAATGRIAAMLDRMVDGAWVSRGLPIPLDRQPLDVMAIVARVIAAQRAASGDAAITLATDLSQLRAVLDRARFERALGGLIDWFAPATPDGVVAVALARVAQGDGEWLVVRASGAGASLAASDARQILARRGTDAIPERAIAELLDARDVATSHGGTLAVADGTALMVEMRLPIVAMPSD